MRHAVDRVTARAWVEAGLMPLSEYIAMFGDEVAADAYCESPNTAPDIHGEHRSISDKIRELLHQR
jgi:hypothetical protein